MADRIDYLIEIIFDETAREDEIHDAIMDLGNFDDDKALNALLKVASSNRNEFLLDACGESIIEIWIRKNQFDFLVYSRFPAAVRNAIQMYIKNKKQEWARFLES
ncbi:hypothetical protein [Criblamydia sequanensis]|uniref:Uncharacterized protein n=1 Tax=Candidatus Criblamydia sequanensis CRIB-18 TaxID=1437425 RepID=A0A090D372_9BACT|nr:hypothetical protein [Criblamydia sequanensis]CDR35008.1 hypothetical protein CSEC_2202 [Criblamydia sequanensis CRIB-18]